MVVENQLWSDYSSHRKISGAKDWNRAAHQLVWRLHGDSMIADMVARMLMPEVSTEDRKELVCRTRDESLSSCLRSDEAGLPRSR